MEEKVNVEDASMPQAVTADAPAKQTR